MTKSEQYETVHARGWKVRAFSEMETTVMRQLFYNILSKHELAWAYELSTSQEIYRCVKYYGIMEDEILGVPFGIEVCDVLPYHLLIYKSGEDPWEIRVRPDEMDMPGYNFGVINGSVESMRGDLAMLRLVLS